MRVIQMLPTLAYGDAVGNDVLALRSILRNAGYEECIITEHIGIHIPKDKVYSVCTDWTEPDADDVIIYHMSIGWNYISYILNSKCKKIAIYHNITPASFFEKYDRDKFILCKDGSAQVKQLNNAFDYCISDSEYNKQELILDGYRCKIDVLPILIPFNDYQQSPDARIFNRYSYKRGTNIVFVGRISPNKKQEDLLAIFSIYQKYYDHEARLFLVGSYDINDSYYQRLITYLNMLGVRNAYFTGHVKFQEVLAYYKIADIFVCMSEHEGFCVPLIEAMLFNIPIIAYDAGAIKETLGDGGILVRNKNYIEIAGLIDYLKNNQGIRARIVKNQKEQIGKFQYSKTENLFLKYLEQFIIAQKRL